MTEPFSLSTLIVEVMTKHESPDPHVVAEAVLAAVPSRHLRTALAEVLPDYVRHFRYYVGVDDPGTDQASRDTQSGTVRSGSSSVSARWKEAGAVFRRRVFTGEAWLFLGDCSVTHLAAVADLRRAMAKANENAADRFDTLAELVRQATGSTVADLDPEVVRGVLAS